MTKLVLSGQGIFKAGIHLSFILTTDSTVYALHTLAVPWENSGYEACVLI